MEKNFIDKLVCDLFIRIRCSGSTTYLLEAAIRNPRAVFICGSAGHALELEKEFKRIFKGKSFFIKLIYFLKRITWTSLYTECEPIFISISTLLNNNYYHDVHVWKEIEGRAFIFDNNTINNLFDNRITLKNRI